MTFCAAVVVAVFGFVLFFLERPRVISSYGEEYLAAREPREGLHSMQCSTDCCTRRAIIVSLFGKRKGC